MDKRLARSVHVLDGEYLHNKSSAHCHLDRPVGNNTKSFNETVDDLLHLEEITLLENATLAVGEQGVTGRNTPAVLPFYMLALKITRLLDISLYNATTNELNELTSPPAHTPPPRQKKQIMGPVFRPILGPVPDDDSIDLVDSLTDSVSDDGCKKFGNSKDCKGMCGLGCWCWKRVCSDCCWHISCYGHDDCCERYGYWHSRCLFASDVLKCDEPFTC